MRWPATEVERRRVPELSAGYNSYSKTWEVVVQYQGDLAFLEGQGSSCDAAAVFVCHSSGSGVPDGLRDRTAADYVSGKPETFVFRGCVLRSVSCISLGTGGNFRLYGDGVLLACIDSGVDYAHRISVRQTGQAGLHFYGIRRFRKSLRLGMLWDRYIHGGRSMRALCGFFAHGRFTPRAVPRCDGARTAVLRIAAGNGRSSADGSIRGVAPEATLVVVKLGNPDPADLPRTSQLLQAVDFCVRYALLVGSRSSLT